MFPLGCCTVKQVSPAVASAPVVTLAVMVVSFTTVKLFTLMRGSQNATPVAPVNPAPVMVTVAVVSWKRSSPVTAGTMRKPSRTGPSR